MNNPTNIDPERLAALIDGKLSDAEASALRTQLAESDDDVLSAFADAVAVSREIQINKSNAADPSRDIRSIFSLRRKGAWVAGSIGFVAAAALMVLVIRRSDSTQKYLAPVFAAAIADRVTATEENLWGSTRGAVDKASQRKQGARLGALLVDYELASVAHRTNEARVAQDILDLSAGVTGGSTIARPIANFVRGSAPLDATQRNQVGNQLATLLDLSTVNAGSYLEAARLAVSARDTTFFDRFAITQLDDLARDSKLDSAAQNALRVLTTKVSTRPRNASEIQFAVEELLRALTR